MITNCPKNTLNLLAFLGSDLSINLIGSEHDIYNTFITHLDKLEDSRKDINKNYELVDIVFLTMAAILSGAKGWKTIKIFGDTKLDWLRGHRPFENGIPTRHSIGRIIRGIKSDSLLVCFEHWVNSIRIKEGREQISFDGKVVRGSGHGEHLDALQLMSAMVVESGLILTQKESEGKKNEIKTMQAMLSSLEVKGAVITADAMHCQTKTAALIQERDADYVLQVKNNQKNLCDEIKAFFHKTERDSPEELEDRFYSDTEGEHGRISERNYQILPVTDWLTTTNSWVGCKSVVKVNRRRTMKGKVQKETSYYITSLVDDVKAVAGYIP
ncbi:MAG: ISAs1 family transposase [Gammaproteobacteria bacterium]|nr:MAG: ISAs1 family transposase [Gammaproteobacteria bacterium]